MDERPGRRVYQTYLHAVCLLTLVVALVAAGSFLYAIVRAAIPGTTGGGALAPGINLIDVFGGGSGAGGERDRGIVALWENGFLGLAAGTVFWFHWRLADRFRGQRADEERPARTSDRKRSTRKRKPSA